MQQQRFHASGEASWLVCLSHVPFPKRCAIPPALDIPARQRPSHSISTTPSLAAKPSAPRVSVGSEGLVFASSSCAPDVTGRICPNTYGCASSHSTLPRAPHRHPPAGAVARHAKKGYERVAGVCPQTHMSPLFLPRPISPCELQHLATSQHLESRRQNLYDSNLRRNACLGLTRGTSRESAPAP